METPDDARALHGRIGGHGRPEELTMPQDLRSYLDLVKRRRPDELVIVSKPIDPAHEITAFVVKLEREAKRRPVLVFENVKGSRFPVLTNLHASRGRLALAINASPEATLPTY